MCNFPHFSPTKSTALNTKCLFQADHKISLSLQNKSFTGYNHHLK